MPPFDPSNNELISLIKINRGANTRVRHFRDAVSICRGRNFQGEREGEEDGWQEIRGATHKQQEGWKKARCEGKKS